MVFVRLKLKTVNLSYWRRKALCYIYLFSFNFHFSVVVDKWHPKIFTVSKYSSDHFCHEVLFMWLGNLSHDFHLELRKSPKSFWMYSCCNLMLQNKIKFVNITETSHFLENISINMWYDSLRRKISYEILFECRRMRTSRSELPYAQYSII